MPTEILTLKRCGDGYYRCWWVDEQGERHIKSFGKNRNKAQARFNEFHGRWRSNRAVRNPGDASELTIAAAFDRFKLHAKAYYVRPDGTPTGEAANFADSMREVLALFGELVAREFTIAHLKQAREAMVTGRLSVGTINARVRKIRQVWRWFVEQQIVPGTGWHELQALRPLSAGRSVLLSTGEAKTPRVAEPVGPVPDAHVWTVVEQMPATIGAMIRLQYWTGMRPGEVCAMCPRDIDTTGKVGMDRPTQHKTQHHQKTRVIMMGPQAQAVLKPWLSIDRAVDKPVFSPQRAHSERCAARVSSYVGGSGRGDYRNWQGYQARQRNPRGGDRWKVTAYARAIRRACDDLELPAWSPNQLRHNAATRLRKQFNLDVVQAVLGHARADITQVYAEIDMEKAVAAMEAVG